MNVTNAIETVGLTKSYGRARGVVDLNLTVPAGEFFGSTLFYKPVPDSLYQALFQPGGGEQPA